jgi:uncharacterized oxidoreductase
MIMADLPTHLIAVDTLQRFVGEIFSAAGTSTDEGARIAHHLIGANLTGHDSHGVIRVPRYVQNLQDGDVLAGQSLTVVTESATHAVLDGNCGFGQTVGPLAVDYGIAKAKAAGMAIVGLRNAGHIGRIGDWGERAAEQGLVSIHFVNVYQGELVAPFGGTDRRFSTNPVCICIPGPAGEPPLLLDFATSVVAEGKVLVASLGGKELPDGALIGPDGKFSTDPATLYGPLTPGGPRTAGNGTGAIRAFGEHKGSGLAFMCEILAGVLTGGGTSGPIDANRARRRITNGMLSIYLDPAHFAATHFVAEARAYADYVKASRTAVGVDEVLVPGEPESRTRAVRLAEGVPLQLDTWLSIVAVARSLGLSEPN